MGRSAVDSLQAEDRQRRIDVAALDDRIAGILAAIEQERTPWPLVELAAALQRELRSRRQRSRPN